MADLSPRSPFRSQHRSPHRSLRAMSLLEITIVATVVGLVGAGVASTLGEQVRRARATDAAMKAQFPHQIARDRAVAGRQCIETVLLDKGEPNPPTVGITPRGNPDINNARVALLEYAACTDTAPVRAIEFIPLDGDVSLGDYDDGAGGTRVVYGPDGGLTASVISTGAFSLPCRTGGDGRPDASGGGGGGVCKAPSATPPVLPDVTFAATTFFGSARSYRIYARAGAIEG